MPLPPEDRDDLYEPKDTPVDSEQAGGVYDYRSSMPDLSDDSRFDSLGPIITEGVEKRWRAD